MAEPTEKSPEINSLLMAMTGRNRVECIRNNICAFCGGPAEKFEGDGSRHEYCVSGMCQECQDKTFGGCEL